MNGEKEARRPSRLLNTYMKLLGLSHLTCKATILGEARIPKARCSGQMIGVSSQLWSKSPKRETHAVAALRVCCVCLLWCAYG